MQRFQSKSDLWLLCVIYAAAIYSLMVAINMLRVAPTAESYAMASLLFVLGFAFPLWLLKSTEYRVEGNWLTVKSGPFTWRIRLDDINGVEETHNPLASPALSLDRLAIRYGDGRQLMVSPKDKQGFLHALGVNTQ